MMTSPTGNRDLLSPLGRGIATWENEGGALIPPHRAPDAARLGHETPCVQSRRPEQSRR